MKKHILFVDDEPNVLEGIGRMLRGLRFELDMRFAGCGRDALEILSQEPIDIIVSDMRMPEMNGLMLLGEVRARHPHVIRMILSGNADMQLIMNSVGLAHQYLSKPCDPDMLRSTITRTLELRKLLGSEILQQLVSRLSILPSVPSLYLEIVKQLQSSNASIHSIGDIIAQDPGMTAKVLQLVNSAFFGIRRAVSDPKDAAAYLGIDTIQSLVLSVHVFSQFDISRLSGFSIDRIWGHSMATAILSKKIIEGENHDKLSASAAFTAGLLHDLGKLVLAANLPDEYASVLFRVARDGASLSDAEWEAFGSTHAEVAAYLLGLWGLPDPIVEAVAFHHRPADSRGNTFGPLCAVYVANLLELEQEGTDSQPIQDEQPYLTAVGKAHRLAEWRQWRREE